MLKTCQFPCRNLQKGSIKQSVCRPQRNYSLFTVLVNHLESVSPLESTSGMDLSEEESSRCFTSRYEDSDETNFTSLTMMSSTTMLYWLRTHTYHLNHN